MPALNFQKQFVDKILSGEKTQTIRATRKHPIKIGDKLYLYTGMRTKYCKKLIESECYYVSDILIFKDGTIIQAGIMLNLDSKHAIAVCDGFYSIYDMLKWFDKNHGKYPFEGQVIKWEKI